MSGVTLNSPLKEEHHWRRKLPRDQRVDPIVRAPKVGRNARCPCASGLKFKKCCGVNR